MPQDRTLQPVPGSAPPPSLPPDAIKTLLDNQTKELEIRAQELALRKQTDDHGFEFGKKALEAQIADRNEQRNHNKGMQRDLLILVLLLAMFICSIIITAIIHDKDAIAIEIIKGVVYVVAGALGGYGLGLKKGGARNLEDKMPKSS